MKADQRPLQSEGNKTVEISPLVESLSGVIKIDADSNPKDEYTDFLKAKYK